MLAIDPTARVAPTAVIGDGVKIGPYCVIGPNVTVGDNCELVAQVHLTGHTTIGAGSVIYPFASLGTPPQSVKYRGGPTRLLIGEKCRIREGVTMNTGTEDGGGVTTVGDDCFFMVGSHVAHDCHVGNHVVFANNAVIGGHVEIGDHCFLGGHCVGAPAYHDRRERDDRGQLFYARRCHSVRLSCCMRSARLAGVNLVGMRRRNVPRPAIHAVRHAYRDLFDRPRAVRRPYRAGRCGIRAFRGSRARSSRSCAQRRSRCGQAARQRSRRSPTDGRRWRAPPCRSRQPPVPKARSRSSAAAARFRSRSPMLCGGADGASCCFPVRGWADPRWSNSIRIIGSALVQSARS